MTFLLGIDSLSALGANFSDKYIRSLQEQRDFCAVTFLDTYSRKLRKRAYGETGFFSSDNSFSCGTPPFVVCKSISRVVSTGCHLFMVSGESLWTLKHWLCSVVMLPVYYC